HAGLAALNKAEKAIPGLKLYTAVVRERLRRLESRTFSTLSEKTLGQSYYLYQLISMENGNDGSQANPYSYLHKGEFAKALDTATEDEKDRVLRLVAISDGADKKWIDQALKLPLPETPLELWISYALKTKNSIDTSAETNKLLELNKDDNKAVFEFLEKTQKSGFHHNFEKQLIKEVDLTTRATAYFISRYLGSNNSDYKSFSKYILFANEKPYIK
ncbi:MAG: hypothetical protein NE330_13185, partial [Lentisphaeraceae bacterium]|nr:hypothetical protein [Lentisphaeraceae bacterium]